MTSPPEKMDMVTSLDGESNQESDEFQHAGHDTSTSKTAGGNIEAEYVTGWRMAVVMLTINLTTFIAALDLGIVATAIPAITEDFHGIDNIGWYSGAIFLVVGCTSAQWGKLFKFLHVKWVFAAALALYLVGSIVAAAAPNSNALIVGRAIQGWGCSGILSGSVIIINYCTEPKQRPMFIGMWVAIFMVSTILGPLLGGVFTTEVTWRWCFWINLPVGGFALVLQVLLLKIPTYVKPAPSTWFEFLRHLDLPGFVVLLSSNICLILALQWGGLTRQWSDGSVIATLVMFVVLAVGFVLVEWISGEYALIPLRLMKPRLTWVQCLYGMMSNAYNFQAMFYLPIYFQSVRGDSAITSGVYTLPLVAMFALGAMIGGAMVGRFLTMHPFQLASGLIATLGAGLLYGLEVNTSKAWYIGAQIPLGFGCGLANQVPVMALQALSKPEDVTTITGIIFTFQTLAGSYFIVSAQSIFENKLLRTLRETAPGVNPESILGAGASQIHQLFTGPTLDAVLNSYMVGIKDVFVYAIACAALSVVLVPLIPFVRLPDLTSAPTEGKSEEDTA